MRFEWWMFVVGAVVSWGVYVPILHEGQARMGGGSPSAGAIRAFLCVGVAYFVTAVVNRTLPPVNAWVAARFTLPGIVAHQSALQGGIRLPIDDFGDAPASLLA